MTLGYIQVKDHPLSIALRDNHQGILNDYIRLLNQFLGPKPNNLITSGEVDQKESIGKMLYEGNISSVFTRVVPESCSKSELTATWGTTDYSKMQSDLRFSRKRLLTPVLEKVIQPYINYIGTVGFNSMKPGTKLTMHYGMISKYVRFHLGLLCDPEAKFHVNNYPPRAWEEGKVWAFDDGDAYHGTTHNGTDQRVILLLDIDRAAFDNLEEETSWC